MSRKDERRKPGVASRRDCARLVAGPQPATLHSRSGFTLVELLVVIAVIAILAALLLPTLTRSQIVAQRIKCVGNLHQLGLAAQMYWDDNGGNCFRYNGTTNLGQLLWCGWLGPGAEGERPFDVTSGVLYPYLQGRGVEQCPALHAALARFKLKAAGVAYGYGYNRFLSPASPNQPPIKLSQIHRPSETVLFADAAQVNDFLPPATPENPLLEEFYYVDASPDYPNGHFRHIQKANTVSCDGHVATEKMVAGSLDPRLPAQFVGRLRTEILVVP